jgi:hypothetical protein
MEQKKKIRPASEIEKDANKLIKSAVQMLTQLTEGAVGCFCRKVIQLQPAQVTSISYDNLLVAIHQMPLSPDSIIKICDSFVTTYPSEVFLKFMDYALLQNSPDYCAEQYDCDDSSVAFCAIARKWHARVRVQLEETESVKQTLPPAIPAPAGARIVACSRAQCIGGAPIGMCQGKLAADGEEHAFNFWISPVGEIVYIEPQNGTYITLGEGAMINFVYI